MKEKKRWGLTCAAVTLLVIALPIVVVLGMGVGIAAAEVVRMNERKKRKKWGDSPLPSSSPYPSSWLLWSWVGMWASASAW